MSIRTIWAMLLVLVATPLLAGAGERPTFNHTRDPRPDILPYWIHAFPNEYRRTYNRPRFWPGYLASKIAPSSQEAMVWEENLRAGRYAERNSPARYKRYFAPKPWEVLQIGPRPDSKKPTIATPANQPTLARPLPAVEGQIVRPQIDPNK
ncbi:MAG: hypothetical protein AAF483_30500 [Planctomycetota bacterium]